MSVWTCESNSDINLVQIYCQFERRNPNFHEEEIIKVKILPNLLPFQLFKVEKITSKPNNWYRYRDCKLSWQISMLGLGLGKWQIDVRKFGPTIGKWYLLTGAKFWCKIINCHHHHHWGETVTNYNWVLFYLIVLQVTG